jgi:hypothetical protein
VAIVVLPDGEPRLQEAAGYSERCSNGASQEVRERLRFVTGEVLRAVQEERAVEPQVFSHAADLVPVFPRRRRWLEGRRQAHGRD